MALTGGQVGAFLEYDQIWSITRNQLYTKLYLNGWVILRCVVDLVLIIQ